MANKGNRLLLLSLTLFASIAAAGLWLAQSMSGSEGRPRSATLPPEDGGGLRAESADESDSNATGREAIVLAGPIAASDKPLPAPVASGPKLNLDVRAWNPAQTGFPSVDDILQSSELNPSGKSASPAQREELARILQARESKERSLFQAVSAEIQASAAIKIEQGDSIDITDAALPRRLALQEVSSVSVAISKGSRTLNVFLREGEFAQLDALMYERSANFREGFEELRAYLASLVP